MDVVSRNVTVDARLREHDVEAHLDTPGREGAIDGTNGHMRLPRIQRAIS